jgi:uncharacterized protein (UPF0297 family)
MKRIELPEAIRQRITDIHRTLGTDGYYALNNRMDFIRIKALAGDPAYITSDEVGEAAVYEWPTDLAIQELAKKDVARGVQTDADALPGALWNEYEWLIEKSDRLTSPDFETIHARALAIETALGWEGISRLDSMKDLGLIDGQVVMKWDAAPFGATTPVDDSPAAKGLWQVRQAILKVAKAEQEALPYEDAKLFEAVNKAVARLRAQEASAGRSAA